MLNVPEENCASPTDMIVKNEKFIEPQIVSTKYQNVKELSPMQTPERASEQDSEENKEKWRLGGYSSSKSNLTNSDDKKMSDWSKKLLENSLKVDKDQLEPFSLKSPK